MQTAPITHYLFQRNEQNFISNRLYGAGKKKRVEELRELWRKIYIKCSNYYTATTYHPSATHHS